jgi:nucleotide-binding universal stress UspA family protein
MNPTPDGAERADPAARRAHRKAQAALGRRAIRLRRLGLDVQTHTRVGAPGDVIIEAAREFDARLILLASHGRGGLERWLKGSVADELLRHSDVPVLVVRAEHVPRWTDRRPTRMLVALDGSQFSETALEHAASLADAIGAELLLVRVVRPPDYVAKTHAPLIAAEVTKEDIAAAQAYLDDLASAHRDAGRQVATRVALGASPAFSLCRIASEEHVDVMAVATHGRGGPIRLALGSVAATLLHESPTPLLVVRPPDTWRTQGTNDQRDALLASSR